MKLVIAALLAATSALTGCAYADSPGDDYTVRIDPAFGDSTDTVLDSLQDWSDKVEASGHHLAFHPIIESSICDSNCQHVITIHWVSQATVTAIANGDGDAWGITERRWYNHAIQGADDWSNIYIENGTPPNVLQQVITHELGHALALHHTGSGTVMCQDNSCAAATVQAADVEQYNSLR